MKRAIEIGVSFLAIILLAPVYAGIALAIWIDSGPPVLFRQQRLGLRGTPFELLKFRTMQTGQHSGLLLTTAGDRRITRAGHFLRRTRLDELPQLWHILRGEMSFVGPRPELPVFVDLSKEPWREVLSVRPGLIDPAALAWLREADVLAAHADPIEAYRQIVLPQKLATSRDYLRRRNFWTDVALMLRAGRRFLLFRL